MALWKLRRTAAAAKVFTAVLEAQAPAVGTTKRHSSDVPGDDGLKTYGYGSYTSNQKNTAALYLARIAVERKDFARAMRLLKLATGKYPVHYSCGTGARWLQNDMDCLFAHCEAGLGQSRAVMDRLLPGCLERNDTLLVQAIAQLYSKKEIAKMLRAAEKSIRLSKDTFLNEMYRDNGPAAGDSSVPMRWWCHTASITLFGYTMDIPSYSLGPKECITLANSSEYFHRTDFYTRLLALLHPPGARRNTVQPSPGD